MITTKMAREHVDNLKRVLTDWPRDEVKKLRTPPNGEIIELTFEEARSLLENLDLIVASMEREEETLQ